MRPLRIEPACSLPEAIEGERWLIERIWALKEVGIIGGEAKSFKSFLALDIAVSVATGTPCLGRYPVHAPGRVLLYAGEDPEADVRLRLESLCRRAKFPFSELDVHVIREPSLRIDVEEDRHRLEDAVARFEPVLFILDPFVRCHLVDENVSAQVVPLLAFLRNLQRRHDCAVSVVHHSKKGTGRTRPGQALRGSSEFHAWGGSNLYLRHATDGEVLLDVEQRSAPGKEGIRLRLESTDERLGLVHVDDDSEVLAPPQVAKLSPGERILDALAAEVEPTPFTKLRALAKMRTQTFTTALAELMGNGDIVKTSNGYEIPF